MSVSGTADFRPDRPENLEVSRRPLAAALAHAAAGYPVIPVRRNKRPCMQGRWGSSDPQQIMAWWSRFPSAQVGIVLDRLGIVVLDLDGPMGEGSLMCLLKRAGATLPSTYEVTTGRGRHRYYAVPPGGCRDLVSQLGHQYGRPELDVKMTWMLVAAGSQHRDGSLYTGSWDHVPTAGELPSLPAGVWAEIERVGRPGATQRPRRDTSEVSERAAIPALPDLEVGVVLGAPDQQAWARDLCDASDGRDQRLFSVVLGMVKAEVPVPDIWATVLVAPLGSKVTEQYNPVEYFLHKVDDAKRRLADEEEPQWDQDDWESAVLAAGLTDSETRVLVHLGTLADRRGIAMRGSGRIAIGAALSDGGVRPVLKNLVVKGWVKVLRDWEPGSLRPRIYQLLVPEHAQIQHPVLLSAAPLSSLSTRMRNLRALTGHDAFRSSGGKGRPSTLSGGYRLLCWLSAGPTSTKALSVHFRCSKSTVRRILVRLHGAGLVKSEGDLHRLHDGPPRALLDAAATTCGTSGMGEREWERYIEKSERNREFRANAKIIGTGEWRTLQDRDHRDLLKTRSMQETVALWAERGTGLDEVAAMITQTYQHQLLHSENCFVGYSVDAA